MLKIHQLCKTFNNLLVLNGINLTLERGEVMAVIGPSGTGKSTLLRCINFLERPESGIIAIDGFKVKVWRENKNCCLILIFTLKNIRLIVFYPFAKP